MIYIRSTSGCQVSKSFSSHAHMWKRLQVCLELINKLHQFPVLKPSFDIGLTPICYEFHVPKKNFFFIYLASDNTFLVLWEKHIMGSRVVEFLFSLMQLEMTHIEPQILTHGTYYHPYWVFHSLHMPGLHKTSRQKAPVLLC